MKDYICIDDQQPFFLTSASYALGRDTSSDIVIPTTDGTASRRHAMLQCDAQGAWSIRDLCSTYGTKVNDQLVRDSRGLHDGDIIQFGGCRIVLHAPRARPVLPDSPTVAMPSEQEQSHQSWNNALPSEDH